MNDSEFIAAVRASGYKDDDRTLLLNRMVAEWKQGKSLPVGDAKRKQSLDAIKFRSDSMSDHIQIHVERAEGTKCPRCWNYHTVRGNPQELCDRCVLAILEGMDQFIAEGRVSQADADEFRTEVKAMRDRWKA